MEMSDRVRFRTFFEEEEQENRFSCNSKVVSDRRAAPRENDDDNAADDDWKVGLWRSATGVCKIARERRGETAAARRKRGLSRDQSSFESLDLRAAEVLDRRRMAFKALHLRSQNNATIGLFASWFGIPASGFMGKIVSCAIMECKMPPSTIKMQDPMFGCRGGGSKHLSPRLPSLRTLGSSPKHLFVIDGNHSTLEKFSPYAFLYEACVHRWEKIRFVSLFRARWEVASMQALESSTSLTSYASGTTTEYPQLARRRGGWEVEKDEPEVVGRKHELDTSQSFHSCRRGELTKTTKPKGYHDSENDTARVLKDLVNSNIDYGVEVSTTVAKTPHDTMDRISVEHLNILNVKENTSEEDHLSYYARGKLWNGPLRERAGYGGQELSSPASHDDTSMKEAGGDCRRASADERTRDAISGSGGTLDRPNHTELTKLSGSKMLPPKGKRSGDLRPPTRPNQLHICINGVYPRASKNDTMLGLQFSEDKQSCQFTFPTYDGALPAYRKINSSDLQRRKRLLKNNDPERRKRIFPSKPPKWKGLATALSVMRSLCHGAGELGVVEAQARPLLIIAGKCVFRTTPPLDTPRLCTVSHQRRCLVRKPPGRADGKSCPTPSSAHNLSEDMRTARSQNHPPSNPVLPLLTSFAGHLPTSPRHSSCRSASPSIKPWPAVVTELDNWISEIVTEWLEKDDRLVTIANSSLRHTSVTIGSPILSSTTGVPSEEKLRVIVVPPVSNISEFPNPRPKPLPKVLEEVGKPVRTPSKKRPTELDARIGQAQTVHDLSQLLEPISQASMSSALGRKVVGSIKISPMSIIQEFGEDDVVQEFQRQIHTLERENEDLKSSLCKEEHSDLFKRLEALHI